MTSGWGPWGLGQWKGHEKVYCRVCGWPVYSAWVDDILTVADLSPEAEE